MKKLKPNVMVAIILSVIVVSCTNTVQNDANKAVTKGKLFIIGGGKRPATMIRDMIRISKVDSSGYIVVLPMSSEFPDTAAYYGIKQFKDQGIENTFSFNMQTVEDMTGSKIDSLKNASLIYISGGDQNRFMEIVSNTAVYSAIHEAYLNGSVIAGTSAGAAVMSKKMITGNEHKYPEYTGYFRTLEANNIEIKEGLGLLQNGIIDQHFVWRMRMNRLISAVLENPEETGIGIDESTAILVEGNTATVYGNYQVIVIRHKSGEARIVNGLLGAENMELNVFLPGGQFKITE